MEERVRSLEITQAVQEEKLNRLAEAIDANTIAVTRLTEIVAASKGAWWAIGGVSSVVALAVTWLVSIFGGRS